MSIVPRRFLGRFLQRSRHFPGIRPRLGRRLTVRMDTTNLCNLRCSMCPMRLSDGDPDRRWHPMDGKLFGRIASEVFPKASVVALSCGAEPFMNPAFADCLRTLWMADVPVREVVTNGLLLKGENAQAVLGFPPTSLFVSIDGARPETHAAIRGGADLGLILENVGHLVRERDRLRAGYPRVSFSVTLQRRNLAELEYIVRLAARVGAASVGTVLLVPYEGLGRSGEVVAPEDPDLLAALGRASRAASETGIAFVPPASGSDPGSVRTGCRYPGSWVFIDPDGLVFPCPYWNVSKPLGDLSAQSFREVWKGRPYEELRRRLAEGILEDNCAVCPEVAGRGVEIVKTGSGKAVQPEEG